MIIPLTSGADATDRMNEQIAELVEQGRTKNQLQQSDFLMLMVAQLQHQDPLDPVSDAEFLSQITQFNILDEVKAFNAALASMEAFQATGLIGKRVEGILEQGGVVQGEVVEVILLNDTATLVLDTGHTLSMAGLVRVLPPAVPDTAAPAAA